MFSQMPRGYTLLNTAKRGKQGDFIIEYAYNGKVYRCLVDIKNYKHKVPTKELDKLYEDISFGSYDAGLIVSYHSKFTGIENSIHIENKALAIGVIPIMYLSEVSAAIITQCIETLFTRVVVTAERICEQSKIETALVFINTSLQQSALVRRVLSDLLTTITSQMNKCQGQLMGLELQINTAIKQISHKPVSIMQVKNESQVKSELHPEDKHDTDMGAALCCPINEQRVNDTELEHTPQIDEVVQHTSDNQINYDKYTIQDALRVKDLLRDLDGKVKMILDDNENTRIICDHFVIHIQIKNRRNTVFIELSDTKYPPTSPLREYIPTTLRQSKPDIRKVIDASN
jgi:hypothetical protein